MDHIYQFHRTTATLPARLSRRVRHTRDWLAKPLLDAASNLRWTRGNRRILIVRHPLSYPRMYEPYLTWLARHFPEVRQKIELRSLPLKVRDWSRYALVVPWLFDPMLHPPRWEHEHVREMEQACAEHGVPVINPLDRVLATTKSAGAAQIAQAGLRTPRAHLITDVARFRRTLDGLSLPLLIREDRAHAGHLPLFRVDSRQDLDGVPLKQFEHPVALEFVDVRRSDGLCCRYRYLVVGDLGIAAGVHASRGWEARGKYRVANAATLAEDKAFSLSHAAWHAKFFDATRILGLDFAAFDYSYTPTGEPVVWEVNTLPGYHPGKVRAQESHTVFEAECISAAMTRLYLMRGGHELPDRLNRWLQCLPTPNHGCEAA